MPFFCNIVPSWLFSIFRHYYSCFIPSDALNVNVFFIQTYLLFLIVMIPPPIFEIWFFFHKTDVFYHACLRATHAWLLFLHDFIYQTSWFWGYLIPIDFLCLLAKTDPTPGNISILYTYWNSLILLVKSDSAGHFCIWTSSTPQQFPLFF